MFSLSDAQRTVFDQIRGCNADIPASTAPRLKFQANQSNPVTLKNSILGKSFSRVFCDYRLTCYGVYSSPVKFWNPGVPYSMIPVDMPSLSEC